MEALSIGITFIPFTQCFKFFKLKWKVEVFKGWSMVSFKKTPIPSVSLKDDPRAWNKTVFRIILGCIQDYQWGEGVNTVLPLHKGLAWNATLFWYLSKKSSLHRKKGNFFAFPKISKNGLGNLMHCPIGMPYPTMPNLTTESFQLTPPWVFSSPHEFHACCLQGTWGN